MGGSITFRPDSETERILRELAPGPRERSELIREALKAHWRTLHAGPSRTSWEIYAALGVKPGKPVRDRARHIHRLLKEKLIAERRRGAV
ncbi:MAG TPA: hypothetical protein VL523_14670 [Terriglobia bacterium]|nr:hypothetical protein [Terriglobia bacterium]